MKPGTKYWKLQILGDELGPGLPEKAEGWDIARGSLTEVSPRKLQADLLVLDHSPIDPTLQTWLESFRQVSPRSIVLLADRGRGDREWYRSAIPLPVDDLMVLPLDEGAWDQLLAELSEGLEAGGELERLRGRLEQTGQDLLENRERLSSYLAEPGKELDELHRQLTRRISQLSTLYQLGLDLSSQSNWDHALEHFLATSVNTLKFSGVALLLWSFEGRRLAARASLHMEEEMLEASIARLKGLSPAERLMTGIAGLHGDTFIDEMQLETREDAWELTLIPLVHGEDAQGYLIYRKHYPHAQAFDQDFHFLKTVQTILSEELAHAKAIHRLKKLGEFNRTVLDSIRAAVLAVDGFGTINYRNPSALELFGERLPLSGPFRFGESFMAGDGEELELGEEDWIQREIQLYEEEDRPPRELLVSSTRLFQRHPQEVEFVLVFEDVTEYKRLTAELRRAERLAGLGELSAGVAHEIRNPLAGISMITQLLGDKLGEDDKGLQGYVDRILGETERLNRIVQSLLEFSRPSEPMMTVFNLYREMGSVLDLVRSMAEKKNVNLELPDSGQEIMVWADRGQLQQVFLNLLRNAVEACEEGQTVGLRIGSGTVGRGRKRVIATVWDKGPGVPPEFEERLFNPFFTTKAEGTGLGLAICLKIVQEHGGSINYRGGAEGGSEFSIDLQPAPTSSN